MCNVFTGVYEGNINKCIKRAFKASVTWIFTSLNVYKEMNMYTNGWLCTRKWVCT